MYSTLFTITLFFALALRVRADLTVYTPVFTQCQPATLTWDATSGPYDVLVLDSNNLCGDPLAEFDNVDVTTFSWPAVTLAAGKQVTIAVFDSTNAEGWSASITVQPGSDSSCLTSGNTDSNSNSNNNTGGSNPNAQSPKSSSTSSPAANPTVLGAANSGLMGNGDSMLRFNGVAVAVTAFGALAALL